jgi:hypothetical protein
LDADADSIARGSISRNKKEEVMIYPISQKQLYLSPFMQFYNYFEKELHKKKLWIVIGYSFRDIVIRTMFEKSGNFIENIILVAPQVCTIKNLFNSEFQNKIIEINGYFGDQKVNDLIKNKLEEINKNPVK